MCGVYGFIGKPTKKTIRAIRLLGIMNEERGQDSAGIAVANGSEFSLYKKAVNSSRFLGKETTRQILWRYRHSEFMTVIGHTRAATIGAVNDDNAHPYRIGKWVFAHNGMINNFWNLQQTYKTNYQVDSQIIGYLLNLYPERRVFDKLLSGWFTVPYMDINDHTQLNIAKNEAPLALAFLKNHKGVYFSSLHSHLKTAMTLTGINAPVTTINQPKIYHLRWTGDHIETVKEKLSPRIPYVYVGNSYGELYNSWSSSLSIRNPAWWE